jgi:Ser/Thr protein kinase RdoA (MazF antagonist)
VTGDLIGPLDCHLAGYSRAELREEIQWLLNRGAQSEAIKHRLEWLEESLLRSWRSISAPPPCSNCGRLMLAGRCCSEAL